MGDLNKLPPPERMPLLDDDVSLRDRFAMAALTGILSNEALLQRQFSCLPGDRIKHEIADLAYRQADAMLFARRPD